MLKEIKHQIGDEESRRYRVYRNYLKNEEEKKAEQKEEKKKVQLGDESSSSSDDLKEQKVVIEIGRVKKLLNAVKVRFKI